MACAGNPEDTPQDVEGSGASAGIGADGAGQASTDGVPTAGSRGDLSQPCERSDQPRLKLMNRVDGEVVPLAKGDALKIELSPQGGFNFQAIAETRGVVASSEEPVRVWVTLEVDGVVTHDLDLAMPSMECDTESSGLLETHVGANVDIVRTPGQVAEYHGKLATLTLSVRNHLGGEASVSELVTIKL